MVFCGTRAGPESARKTYYYADPTNKFWNVLFEVGLTPRRLAPHQFRDVLRHGIGLTDVAKTSFGTDASLPPGAGDQAEVRRKTMELKPRVLAFNGKRAAAIFFAKPKTSMVVYGRHCDFIGSTAVFVLPSTSGNASKYWDRQHWNDLAEFLRGDNGEEMDSG